MTVKELIVELNMLSEEDKNKIVFFSDGNFIYAVNKPVIENEEVILKEDIKFYV